MIHVHIFVLLQIASFSTEINLKTLCYEHHVRFCILTFVEDVMSLYFQLLLIVSGEMLFQNLAYTRKIHRVQLGDRKVAHSGVIWNILSISKFMKNYTSYIHKFIYTYKFIVMRESIPRQVDKKSPRREGSGILKEEERTNVFFFLLYIR